MTTAPRKPLRYWPRGRKLELLVTDETVEQIVIAAVRVLIPRVTGKVYFIGRPDLAYDLIAEFAKGQDGFTIATWDNSPRNGRDTWCLSHGDEMLRINPHPQRVAVGEWRAFADELERKLNTSR